ncbi:hypothetical protein [Synechococcus sp. CC9616]|uniref:hypothetical protein n=1 Tax=Synechococcus sp. CC9616 TaxID=110663 RepID=UPI000491F4F4|nr:hypothetical protein [Synechococcus sp. CC9616]
MPQRHWLDPLARQVLQATGQLPRPVVAAPQPTAPQPPAPPSWTMDVNRASRDQWVQLPGCGSDRADLLVRLQQGGVQFSCADDLFRLLELPADLAALWHPHLIFHWHGDAPLQPVETPVDLNTAATAELQRLQWPDDRVQRLLQERRRQGFQDLADLQERLCLPASTVESLIGRVCFGQRRAGPSLPPRT